MGQVIHLHHRGIFGRATNVNDNVFLRREVITTPSAQPAAETPQAAGDYLRKRADSLTAKQARELALITAAGLAKDPEARAMLQRKADQVALGLPSAMSLPPIEAVEPVAGEGWTDGVQRWPLPSDATAYRVKSPLYHSRHKPVTLMPWILGLLAVAAVLSLLPPLFS
ncbi:hypothetical protein ABAC460_10110 [Asticcacaulis sp. AC460]|uniref:hypothetical protein n=1 Tax=Asticcacaulis sp. AC460 TaxID=1282360 RepID=UPI0003C3E7C0|nr:hypothetical protein [Asticcacaulis sp. AC460]ESQ90111.1 hypothetical protein ABAC460_10110 [Asticcacaulis sp. AC460]